MSPLIWHLPKIKIVNSISSHFYETILNCQDGEVILHINLYFCLNFKTGCKLLIENIYVLLSFATLVAIWRGWWNILEGMFKSKYVNAYIIIKRHALTYTYITVQVRNKRSSQNTLFIFMLEVSHTKNK